jgi:type I restriction enzyme, S subunit
MILQGWKKVKWGDVATIEYGKSLKDYRASGGPFPVYGTNGLIGYTDKSLCPFPSVIVGRKGAYRGIHYSKTPFYVIDTAFYLKPKGDELNLKYAYYQLLTLNINEMDSGSAIPSTSRPDFYNLDLCLPDIYAQQKIASILSSLDNKIELNLQMNKNLEAIAQAIFKEWFVDFRFPGFNGELADGLPKGWRKGAIGDIISVQNGYAFKSKDFIDNGENGIIKIKNIANNVVDIINVQYVERDIAERVDPKFIVSSKDLLIAMTGAEVGKVGIVPQNIKNLLLNQRVGLFKEKIKFAKWFCYLILSSDEYQGVLLNTASGSAQPNISSNQIEGIEVILPTYDIIESFGTVINSFFDKMTQHHLQNQTLVEIRDTLLPKLMTGKIRVT